LNKETNTERALKLFDQRKSFIRQVIEQRIVQIKKEREKQRREQEELERKAPIWVVKRGIEKPVKDEKLKEELNRRFFITERVEKEIDKEQITKDMLEGIQRILQKAKSKRLIIKIRPPGILAGAFYLAMLYLYCDFRLFTQKQIGDIIGVSEYSTRNGFRALRAGLELRKLFPSSNY
jgi:hypothetical protein